MVLWSMSVYIGGIILGIIGDKMGVRTILMPLELLLASLCLFVINTEQNDFGSYAVLSILTGLLAGGPYNNLNAVIPVDIGVFFGNTECEAVSLVSSLMEGFGTFMAGFTLLIIATLEVSEILLVISLYFVVAALALLPIAFQEFVILKIRRK